ncbi:unnamed protein product [Blepharisma stoltei]|uniref:Uncharacterized protein n=1 Tax=Blepharisma stoltei TaxID=1481888 RepID=A0AAU9JBY7_9CILI|nr:unnamed protein product [Blepharisma stoltei]
MDGMILDDGEAMLTTVPIKIVGEEVGIKNPELRAVKLEEKMQGKKMLLTIVKLKKPRVYQKSKKPKRHQKNP